MNAIEPLITVHSGTGAFRAITTDLLAETYLAPRPESIDLQAILADEIFPWSSSMTVAPTETAASVSSALRSLVLATKKASPNEINLEALDPDSRLYKHLHALCLLWRETPAALPEDLQVYAHVLGADASMSLEPLPLVEPEPCRFATPLERQLRDRLIEHHGLADPTFQSEWNKRKAPLTRGATEGTSLWRAQQGLTGQSIKPATLDDTLKLFALRDEAEEADFAAARAQHLIDQGASPRDIGLLVPDEMGYITQLERAFAERGVPLSGLPTPPENRDIAGETLYQLLLCFQAPAPAMALASLYISPLMPWPKAMGLQLAHTVMSGHFDPDLAKDLTGRAQRFYQTVRSHVDQTPKGLSQALKEAANYLSDAPEHRKAITVFRSKLSKVQARLAQSGSLDWNALYQISAPTALEKTAGEHFVEGVSVWMEGDWPSRPTRHLIALGMSGDRWPRPVSASPLFLDGELKLLKQKTGIGIETRSQVLQQRIEKLRRQLLSASDSLTLLRPLYATNGTGQPPAPALSLVARTISNDQKEPADLDHLIIDLGTMPPESWPFKSRVASQSKTQGVDATSEGKSNTNSNGLPKDGFLRLERNLLEHRLNSDGEVRPQSPSSLEKLIISPLAWSLEAFGVKPVVWAPDEANVRVLGNVAHHVLELLFPKDADLPDEKTIEAELPKVLKEAIRQHAPFLERSIWAVEYSSLLGNLQEAARAWRHVLKQMEASIIDNELWLQGQALGIALHGRVDCLLQLPDGSLLVVDHKKSGTPNRRQRLDAGWDLQVGLYREMLKHPQHGSKKKNEVLEHALANKPNIGIAYHLINDQGVLLEGLDLRDHRVTVVEGEISSKAMSSLRERLAEVKTGKIRLNTEDDRAFFEKEAKLTPYALDRSPLVSYFMMPSTQAEGNGGPSDD